MAPVPRGNPPVAEDVPFLGHFDSVYAVPVTSSSGECDTFSPTDSRDVESDPADWPPETDNWHYCLTRKGELLYEQ